MENIKVEKETIDYVIRTYDYPTLIACNECTWEGDLGELIIILNGNLVPPTCPRCDSNNLKIIRKFKI